jgi:hypothetical protein
MGDLTRKHTPGPWTVHSLEDCKFSVVHGGPLTYVSDNGNGAENAAANAALMAAAPEILDALLELIAEHDRRVEDLWRDEGTFLPDTGGVAFARQVIRKALA